jgi:hypothetical protein
MRRAQLSLSRRQGPDQLPLCSIALLERQSNPDSDIAAR